MSQQSRERGRNLVAASPVEAENGIDQLLEVVRPVPTSERERGHSLDLHRNLRLGKHQQFQDETTKPGMGGVEQDQRVRVGCSIQETANGVIGVDVNPTIP